MIASLMLYTVVVGLLLASVGAMADHAASLRGATRRWLWAGVLAASLTLPLITLWRAAAPLAVTAPASWFAVAAVAASPESARWTVLSEGLRHRMDATLTVAAHLDGLLLALWLTSSALIAAACLTGSVIISRRRRAWRESVVRDHRVLIAPDTGPAVVGLITPRIVLPAWALQLDEASVGLILSHEQEHVRSGDQWLVHLRTVALFVMPWNPFAWWMAARLRLAVELDCDARVLSAAGPSRASVAAYGDLLLTVAAHRTSRSPLVVPALIDSSSTLTRRISAMFPEPVRFAAAKVAVTFAAAAALALAVVAIPAPRAFAQAQRANAAVQPASQADSQQSDSQQPAVHQPASEPAVRPQPTVQTQPAVRRAALQPAPADQTFGAGAYRIGSQPQFRAPTVVHNVKPVYTVEAMQDKIVGDVMLEVVVESDGRVGDARVTTSLDPGLDEEALAAARQWLFMPGTIGEVAVPTVVELHMTFSIR